MTVGETEHMSVRRNARLYERRYHTLRLGKFAVGVEAQPGVDQQPLEGTRIEQVIGERGTGQQAATSASAVPQHDDLDLLDRRPCEGLNAAGVERKIGSDCRIGHAVGVDLGQSDARAESSDSAGATAAGGFVAEHGRRRIHEHGNNVGRRHPPSVAAARTRSAILAAKSALSSSASAGGRPRAKPIASRRSAPPGTPS